MKAHIDPDFNIFLILFLTAPPSRLSLLLEFISHKVRNNMTLSICLSFILIPLEICVSIVARLWVKLRGPAMFRESPFLCRALARSPLRVSAPARCGATPARAAAGRWALLYAGPDLTLASFIVTPGRTERE